MKATVSEKGQVTIPKHLRDSLGIRPGQILDFKEDNGRLVVSKVSHTDPVEKAFGILLLDRSSDEILGELRGEADVE